MSAIASFYLVNKNKLDGLSRNTGITAKRTLFGKKSTDTYYDFLEKNTVHLHDFDGSGYIFGNLFPFLTEKGIDLPDNGYKALMEELSNKRECSHCIITFEQKEKYIRQLESTDYSTAELQSFSEQFSGEGDEEYALLAINGIKALVASMYRIENSNQVLLMIIG